MNGIALSPLTMIRLPFLLGFFLLLTGSAPFADAASSGQEQGDGGVVHIGIQETLDPEFFVDTLGPTMRHLRKRFPHLRFHAETFSHQRCRCVWAHCRPTSRQRSIKHLFKDSAPEDNRESFLAYDEQRWTAFCSLHLAML